MKNKKKNKILLITHTIQWKILVFLQTQNLLNKLQQLKEVI